MDATVYTFLIHELLKYPEVDLGDLPLSFTNKSPVASSKTFADLSIFLQSVVKTSSFKNYPEKDSDTNSFYNEILTLAHSAIIEILAGEDPQNHSFRGNGINLARFLTFAVHNDKSLLNDSIVSLAKSCFLLEALMHIGYCPGASENAAKRAAHSYFICLKKSLHNATAVDIPFIIGYMWGAYLLGQKTEGFHDDPLALIAKQHMFEWKIGDIHKKYIGIKQERPFLFLLIPVKHKQIPHPFTNFALENRVGISLSLNNQTIAPYELVESTEINRSKIKGYKFNYKANTTNVTDLSWTIAILFSESTIYRIDTLSLSDSMDSGSIIRAVLKLECSGEPKLVKNDFYIANNQESTIIRFIENPLRFSFKSYQNGIAEFTGVNEIKEGTNSVQMVTAWAKGKGISAIQETKLLGIYE